jgi:rhamnogalacturonan hydrolase
MFMIKSNGGSGTVKNCQFNNFIGHSNAYSLDFNAYWASMTPIAGDGITYEDITFNNCRYLGGPKSPISACLGSSLS